MAKGEIKKQEVSLSIPEGVDVLHKLSDELFLCMADIGLLLEQDKNAHIMKSEMFRQLTENVKNRGALESTPLCALTDRGVEIVSGHHRVRAAKQAELKTIHILLDVTNLSRSKIVAKQIDHNAINGFDDPSIMKELVKMIEDVDDMIESYIGKDILEIPDEELQKMFTPALKFDWKEIGLVFLPHQIKDLELFVSKANGGKSYLGAVPVDNFENTISSISKFQKFSNIMNIGAAVHRMIEIANETMDKAEFDKHEEWISLSKILGNVAVPKEDAENLSNAINSMVEKGEIDKSRKWEGLKILVENFMSEDNGKKK